jgi:hypothetical protein
MGAISEEDRKMLDSGTPEMNRIRYTNFIIFEFAQGFKRPVQEAFQYLDEFGGLEFLDTCYEYEHTQAPYITCMNLLEVCRKNGGWL